MPCKQFCHIIEPWWQQHPKRLVDVLSERRSKSYGNSKASARSAESYRDVARSGEDHGVGIYYGKFPQQVDAEEMQLMTNYYNVEDEYEKFPQRVVAGKMQLMRKEGHTDGISLLSGILFTFSLVGLDLE